MGPFNFGQSAWLVLLVSVAVCQLPVHRPANQDEYFGLIWGKNHSLVGYINTRTEPSQASLMDRLFDRLSRDPRLADWGFSLIVADVARIEMLYNHYSMTGLPNFYYFVRKQLLKCPDFSSVFSEALSARSPESLVDFGQNWIHERLDNLVLRLESLADFEHRLADRKIIAIYFGPENGQFRRFQHWASRYIHFPFFTTSSPELRRDIFASRHLAAPSGDSPVLAVVRHTDLVSEFDPNPIVATVRVGNERELSQFFEFERFPKLMDPSLGSNITQMLFYNNEKLVVLITSSSTPAADISAFHNALAELPKRMIYSQIDLNSPHIAAFMQLFMLAKVNMAPGRLYAVNVLPTRQVEIRDMQGGLTVGNIVNFVAGVIEQHADFFGVSSPESQTPEDKSAEAYETDL